MTKFSSHLILLFFVVTVSPYASADIPLDELNAATAALRSAGYDLFANALSVSDVLYQILGGDEFTLLSPPDPSLFSLDMAVDSFRYVHSLRIHVLARRLPLTDLRNISQSNTPFVDSLSLRQPPLALALTTDADNNHTTTGANASTVTVEGVRILWPDIFVGPHLAVHGLEGSLIGNDLLGDLGGGGGSASKPGSAPLASSSSPSSFPEKIIEEEPPLSISFPPSQNLGFYPGEVGSPSPSPSIQTHISTTGNPIPSSQDRVPTPLTSGLIDQYEGYSSSTTLPPIDAVFSQDLTIVNSISAAPSTSQGPISTPSPVSAPVGFASSPQSSSQISFPRRWFPAERISPGHPTILSPWIDRLRKGDKSYIRGMLSPKSSNSGGDGEAVANSPAPALKEPDFVLTYPTEIPPLTQSDAGVSYYPGNTPNQVRSDPAVPFPANSPTQNRADSVVVYPANSPTQMRSDSVGSYLANSPTKNSVVSYPANSPTGVSWSMPRRSDLYSTSPTGQRRKRSRRRRHHHHHDHDGGHKGL